MSSAKSKHNSIIYSVKKKNTLINNVKHELKHIYEHQHISSVGHETNYNSPNIA